jgi:pyruvate kinase
MPKKTKIIATISNKNCSVEFLRSLFEAGMNVVRLNTAHQNTDDALEVIKNVRAVSDKIAILVDTKGPEIRVNELEENFEVKRGDIVKLKGAPGLTGNRDCVYVTYSGFVKDVKVGSKILIDDGILELLAIKVENEALVCEVQNHGKIQGRKSINIPSAMINLPALTRKDMDFIRFAAEQELDFIAHSFVRKAEDVIAVQSILDAMESPIKIIAKIENKEGVDNIDSILEHVYGVMVARGDLAVEISEQKLPTVQRMLVKKCVEARKPVIVATQMLHTMIENPRPTRAEVNDIANAIYEGTDAVMLSGETAYGKYPLEAVQMMTSIAQEVEADLPAYLDLNPLVISSAKAAQVIKAAIELSANLPIKGIIADTSSGKTARALAAYRGRTPIIAQCYSAKVARHLALSFGVYTGVLDASDHDQFVKLTIRQLLEQHNFKLDDQLVVVAGNFGKEGGTSLIEIGSIEELLKFIGEK